MLPQRGLILYSAYFILKVGDESDVARIQCKCNHLTSFASDFFVAPNPIDIDKVLEGFKNINDNVSVVVLLSLLFGLFLLLAVRLRRRDKEDASKVCSFLSVINTILGARDSQLLEPINLNIF